MHRFGSRLSLAWARGKIAHIEHLLPDRGSIIDIGSGRGVVTAVLRDRGYAATPLDVRDRSVEPALAPVLYDGGAIPFPDRTFDCALLLTVLHHTPEPDAVLREAARVARRLIVIEDVYTNAVQKHLTFFTDSLFNLEFRGHPHSNRTDAEWRKAFVDLGLELEAATVRERRVLLFYRQVAYGLIRSQ
ncbi:MAG: class I SAM-dependent methyltransferase [Spirochaetaceae bacterium]|nr:MAG: class I SAM-dependent methyltransferase [Spirochaetaceae bacterium]